MNITSLKSIIPLAIAVLALVGYNYIDAQSNPPIGTPPDNNVAAPINAGATTQSKNGTLGLNYLNVFTESPTIRFFDETVGHVPFWLHNNSSRMYFIADRNSDGSWTGESPWPMEMFASSTVAGDFVRFSNQLRVPEICNGSGGDCFTPSEVAPLNTSSFLNNTATAQTKAGNLTAGNLFTAGNVRTANLCDAAGGNCTAPAAILDTTASAQTKSGNLELENTVPQLRLTDTDGRDTFLRTNDNQFYVLADRNNDGTLDAPHPLQMTLAADGANDYATFANDVRANGYCNRAGTKCITPGTTKCTTVNVKETWSVPFSSGSTLVSCAWNNWNCMGNYCRAQGWDNAGYHAAAINTGSASLSVFSCEKTVARNVCIALE